MTENRELKKEEEDRQRGKDRKREEREEQEYREQRRRAAEAERAEKEYRQRVQREREERDLRERWQRTRPQLSPREKLMQKHRENLDAFSKEDQEDIIRMLLSVYWYTILNIPSSSNENDIKKKYRYYRNKYKTRRQKRR